MSRKISLKLIATIAVIAGGAKYRPYGPIAEGDLLLRRIAKDRKIYRISVRHGRAYPQANAARA